MKKHNIESKIEGTLKLGGGIKEMVVKRDINTIGYLIAVYATLITISTAIISILPINEYLRAVIITLAVVGLCYFLLRTTKGRALITKELVKLIEFEEGYTSK
jgi:hypothetical protein